MLFRILLLACSFFKATPMPDFFILMAALGTSSLFQLLLLHPMKRSFTLRKVFNLLPLVFILTQSVKAQGNLKFSQVKYVVLNGTGIAQSQSAAAIQVLSTQNIIVASNHVLKIESVTGLQLNTNIAQNSTSYYAWLSLDDANLSKSNSTVSQAFPIWLPAGTYSLMLSFYNSSAGCFSCGTPASVPVKAGVSAIDFEIIP